MSALTPKQVVAELDKYIIGQEDAKKAVAIALRNRYRRQLVQGPLKDEISPKNILMIGPTGVGKTEIARRLATLADAPFLKVEVTKFTELGYMGRDVDSLIRDLMRTAVSSERQRAADKVKEEVEGQVEEKLLNLLLQVNEPPTPFMLPASDSSLPLPPLNEESFEDEDETDKIEEDRDALALLLKKGELEERLVSMEIPQSSMASVVGVMPGGASMGNMEDMEEQIQDMMQNVLPNKKKEKRLPIKRAREIIRREEEEKLMDMEEVEMIAKKNVEENGIVFLDEIDKVVTHGDRGSGPEVSREGVQRDLLPLLDGCTVHTRHGAIKTRHILFIAAGAFHLARPSDLIPELQGRIPIRVELTGLTSDDFRRILIEPRNSLSKQYIALLETEGVELIFTDEGVHRIAELADRVNQKTENIGARRLHTLVEKCLEEVLYEVPERDDKKVIVDEAFVNKGLEKFVEDVDLSRYIL